MRAFIYSLIGLMLLVPAFASAQTFQGGVRGAVRDADGGVLPGTTVTLTNDQTGIARTSVTNERGEYVFSSVAPGNYTLVVELTGFAPFRREALQIGVQTFLVQDVSLQVGGIAESVTVTGETPLIETATASIASAIDKAQLEVLPSPGRNVFIYSVTTPNVVHTGDPIFVRKQDQTNSSLLSLAGGPLRGNNYTIDGVAITDMVNRATVVPNNDAVEEMKVQVNTYDAEMGRTGGGVFNVLHKSGTNNWGGSALWQNRPSWGRGLLFFEETDRGGSGEAPDQPYNLWSFAGGGPIVRDKTFFWASYEGYKNTESRNAVITLPTAAQVNGNFAGGPTIYDPLTYNPATGTRSPFPGNVIPANRIDPAGKALADLLLTVGEGPIPMTALLRNTANEPTFKIDHSFNERWQLSGTYLYYKSEEPANPFYTNYVGASEPLAFDTGAAILFRNVNSVAINLTNIPSDDSVVTVRYGYNRFYDSNDDPIFDIADLPFSSTFQQQFNDAGLTAFPAVDVEGYGTDENTTSSGTHGSWNDNDITWKSQELSGVYSKFVGSHTIKAGLQYRKIGVDTFDPGYGAAFYFEPGLTQGPSATSPAAGTGDAMASLLLGLPTDDSYILQATPANVFVNYYGGFIHDDWRVNENLVVNLGLRLEHETGLNEEENRFAVGWSSDPFPVQVGGLNLTGGLVYAGTGGKDTQGDPKGLKLGPRAGFVYTLNQNTVLRGGYGIFWAPTPYPTGQNNFATRGYTAVTNVFSSNDGGLTPNDVRLQNPFPNGVAPPTGNSLGALTGAGGEVHFNDQNSQSPYIQQYSIDIQRELGAGMAFKIGYLGSRGSDLWIGGTFASAVNINQLDPQFLSLGSALNDSVPNPFFGNPAFGSLSNSETIARGQLLRPYPQFQDVWAHNVSAGKSTYNALRVEWEKKFRQWGARVNYTLSSYKANVLESNTRVSDEENRAFNSRDLEENDLPTGRIDSPHWLNINGLYRFPSPAGGAAEAVLGGWSASVTTIIRSGFPLTVTQSSNQLRSFGYENQRPNLVGDPSVSDPRSNYEQFINPAAFSQVSGFELGDTPSTITDQRTAPLLNWDVSFDKATNLGNGQQILLRFELINIFGQPNFNGPRSILGQSNFGAIQGVGGFPRVFQFMLKYAF
ncbi:MAG TPA: TonB-dependent receptor [Vicinamibacteria bacterium]|nr:TonB-dependent receptor [Vicinamibacteria bacterium]